jgi:hypothetical protein
MKVSLKTPENQKAIALARTQITNSADLRNFDTFLSKYQVIDFADEEMAAAAKSSCFGENCCQTINISFSFKAV